MRKVNAISVMWNGDDTFVRHGRYFDDSPWVTRADILKDAIFMLTEEYERLLAQGIESERPH
jgi:hypothetical protein